MKHRFHALRFLVLASMSFGLGLVPMLSENGAGKRQIELIAESGKKKPAKAPDWVGEKNGQPDQSKPDTSKKKAPKKSKDSK